MISVLVAAPRGPARARLEAAVAGAARLATARAGLPLRDQIRAVRPDVVLLDLEGVRLDTALAEIGSERARVIALVDDAPPVGVETVRRSGAGGVLPRGATAREIAAAVQAVAAGLVVLHPDTVGARRRRGPARPVPDAARPLTARELEVLGMLAEGLGNKAIAARLAISTHTAKFHVAAILDKLGAGSRTEAVALGMRRGLVAI